MIIHPVIQKIHTVPSYQRFFFYTMSFWLAIKKIMNNKLNFKKAMIQTRHPSKHHHEWIHRRLLMYLSTAFTAPSHTLNFWFWKCWCQFDDFQTLPTHQSGLMCQILLVSIFKLTYTHTWAYFTECHTSISHQLSKFYLLFGLSLSSFLFMSILFFFIRLLVFHLSIHKFSIFLKIFFIKFRINYY